MADLCHVSWGRKMSFVESGCTFWELLGKLNFDVERRCNFHPSHVCFQACERAPHAERYHFDTQCYVVWVHLIPGWIEVRSLSNNCRPFMGLHTYIVVVNNKIGLEKKKRLISFLLLTSTFAWEFFPPVKLWCRENNASYVVPSEKPTRKVLRRDSA